MIEGFSSGLAAGLVRADPTQSVSGAGAGQSQPATATGLPLGAGPSVGDVLRDQITASINSVKTAETASVAGMTGEMDARAVTDAVLSAERQLQAAVAIRDKIVTAYLDMSRMQI